MDRKRRRVKKKYGGQWDMGPSGNTQPVYKINICSDQISFLSNFHYISKCIV